MKKPVIRLSGYLSIGFENSREEAYHDSLALEEDILPRNTRLPQATERSHQLEQQCPLIGGNNAAPRTPEVIRIFLFA